jgi:hypothetical protein
MYVSMIRMYVFDARQSKKLNAWENLTKRFLIWCRLDATFS